MVRKVRPELVAVDTREGRLAAQVEGGDGLQPGSAEEPGERAPAVLEQRLRRLGIGEDPRLDLLEDAVARKRPQDAVEDVGVGVARSGELVDRTRAVDEGVRD